MSDMQTVMHENKEESGYSAFYNTYKLGDDSENGSFSARNNNSLLNLSPEQELYFKFIVQGVGITTVATVGIIGNIFSVCVLSKKKMRSPIGCFLLGLALADTIFVLIGTAVIGIPSFLAYIGALGDIGIGKTSLSNLVFLTPLFFGLALTSQTASVYFTVAVTTERFIAICYPFRARSMLTLKRAVIISVGIMLFSIVYNSPRWWEYNTFEIYDDVTNEFVGYRPVPSKLRLNPIYDIYYVYFSYLLLMEVLPIIVLCILNVKIYRRIRSANKQRQTLSSSQKHENSLAMMLIVIVSIFLVCNIFPLIESLIQAIRNEREMIVELECIRNFLVMFNSSINFAIYCFFGEKFRDVFLEMWPSWVTSYLCCCCPAPDKRLRYWNASISEGCSEKRRISWFTSSTRTLQDVTLEGISTNHI